MDASVMGEVENGVRIVTTCVPTAQAHPDATPNGRRRRSHNLHASLLHPHIHSDYPSRAAADANPSLHIRFLFPSRYVYDVLTRASLAQTLLVSDCTVFRDYPLSCFISDTLYLAEDAPHHLIITLRLCTLRVCPMPSILASCFTLRVPHTIQPS